LTQEEIEKLRGYNGDKENGRREERRRRRNRKL